MSFSGSYYGNLLRKMVEAGDDEGIDSLGNRLADAEDAMTILRYRGYEGPTLADMVKKAPPATLRHS